MVHSIKQNSSLYTDNTYLNDDHNITRGLYFIRFWKNQYF